MWPTPRPNDGGYLRVRDLGRRREVATCVNHREPLVQNRRQSHHCLPTPGLRAHARFAAAEHSDVADPSRDRSPTDTTFYLSFSLRFRSGPTAQSQSPERLSRAVLQSRRHSRLYRERVADRRWQRTCLIGRGQAADRESRPASFRLSFLRRSAVDQPRVPRRMDANEIIEAIGRAVPTGDRKRTSTRFADLRACLAKGGVPDAPHLGCLVQAFQVVVEDRWP